MAVQASTAQQKNAKEEPHIMATDFMDMVQAAACETCPELTQLQD